MGCSDRKDSTIQLAPEVLPWLTSGAPILVGFSGGRDSTALLLLLAQLPNCHPIACHVHHGIRKCTADDDARFTELLAHRLRIPYVIEYMDVPRIAQQCKISLETAARQARQECFANWSRQWPGSVVALAHHLDDQAETILFRLCRGCSRISGMKPVDHWPGNLTVLRPLLYTTRHTITQWLRQRQEPWQEDETNTDVSIPRNAIRQEILPRLHAAMQRDISPILARSARLNDEQARALDQALDLLQLEDPQGRLFLPKIYSMPAELQKAALFRFLRGKHIPELSEQIIQQVQEILPPNQPSKTTLPGGFIASRKERRLTIIPPKDD